MRDCEQRLVTRSECDIEHSIGGALCRCRRVGARRRTAQHSRCAGWCARVQEVQRDGPIGGAAAFRNRRHPNRARQLALLGVNIVNSRLCKV